jgi:hypothetical protein
VQQRLDGMLLRIYVALSAEYGAQVGVIENVPVTNQEQRPVLIGEHGGAGFARGGPQETKSKHDLAGAIYVVGGAVRPARLERREHRG